MQRERDPARRCRLKRAKIFGSWADIQAAAAGMSNTARSTAAPRLPILKLRRTAPVSRRWACVPCSICRSEGKKRTLRAGPGFPRRGEHSGQRHAG